MAQSYSWQLELLSKPDCQHKNGGQHQNPVLLVILEFWLQNLSEGCSLVPKDIFLG